MAVLQPCIPRHVLPSKAYLKVWRRCQSTGIAWRSPTALDEWVEREAKPISLRQLTVFGRSLTEARLISSANYVRTELPTRIAHRLRDMQTLPYVVITNPHMSHVYDLYYKAFDSMRRLPEVKTVEENDKLCSIIQANLQEHLSVIPRLVSGVIECQHLVTPDTMDSLMNTILRSRISRRVIAEQHLALTETFHEPWHFPNAKIAEGSSEFIGEVFLRCNAKEVVDRCAKAVQDLCHHTYGSGVAIPEVKVLGHLEATLTYIPSHLEYIIGELLRNSMQALIERRSHPQDPPPPIEVLICEAPQHVIFRISDRGGGVPAHMVPYLWSFVKGPRKQMRLENLNKVPQLNATLQEIQVPDARAPDRADATNRKDSLGSLSIRPPDLRLGIGLPMSKVYAEYWAGSIQLHNLEGYGVDTFLQISKLGNKNEQLSTRAAMDAL
ncbi:hypothetical protein FH972_024416 [Carpinus fangiana]|uniref:Protein-serine/threonine kinase n=1 Tax=Carpinus fangiana TaxID=176857 RepID=A0A5N6KXZ2_9ROSI|nr:hypothetical protein FH972_024416 [Carpinus fangiana]